MLYAYTHTNKEASYPMGCIHVGAVGDGRRHKVRLAHKRRGMHRVLRQRCQHRRLLRLILDPNGEVEGIAITLGTHT